ncbi:MAG: hypothetical protein I3273_05045 [Candidatus Moeniiplasma glomeromycotorum]|nr:hypothetical protein [Candidatus Moeniiplasma glomeromycotorum]MCE8167909.1 hypothetical protein [Candidatus Moeniiplasma glomeromycotorum]MCE8169459.1 hypothetical protein [Candidatus Moeniiplasma glomeromycotorum]
MVEYSDIYSNLDCFQSFQNSLIRVVKTYYFGLVCKLRGEGKLLTIWFNFVKILIEHGKVAIIYFGGKLLLAEVVDGYETQTGEWADLRVLFFGDKKGNEFEPGKGQYVIFQWGDGNPFDLSECRHDILEMWYLKGLIGWDQDKSKKRVDVEFEKDPGKDGWKHVFNSYEKGFLGVVAPKNITNQIKKWSYFESKNNAERQQLWKDYREVESRFFFRLGIRHNPFVKEERQNNPEVMSGQSYFDAWEFDKQEGVLKGILEFQAKSWGGGKYTLQFGSLPTLLIENQTTQLLAQANFENNQHPFLKNN